MATRPADPRAQALAAAADRDRRQMADIALLDAPATAAPKRDAARIHALLIQTGQARAEQSGNTVLSTPPTGTSPAVSISAPLRTRPTSPGRTTIARWTARQDQ
jgi:hypothetical protein